MFIWKIICPIPWKYIVSFGSYYLEMPLRVLTFTEKGSLEGVHQDCKNYWMIYNFLIFMKLNMMQIL